MKPYGLRYWENPREWMPCERFVARDVGRTPIRPEHAVWLNGRVVWREHAQGGFCSPFTGPDEVWKRLIDGARRL